MAESSRDRVERGFERWGRTVVSHPLAVLLASLAVACGCMAGLPRVYVDVTFEGLLGRKDEVRVSYEALREQFGRDERITIAVTDGGPGAAEDVFEFAFLEKLRALHETIEERVPHLVEITSLLNARDTRGEGDTLLVEDFLDPWPQNEEELAARRSRALSNSLFHNNVISLDGRVATIILELELYSSLGVEEEALSGFDSADDAALGAAAETPPPLLTGPETGAVIEALGSVIDEFDAPDFKIASAGSAVMLQTISAAMARDMPRFVGLAIAAIAVLLFLLFRHVIAVLIPLAVIVLSVASTLGLMGWSGVPIHVPTQILPSFLLAVAVGDAVHLLSIFFEQIRAGETREDALCHALGHSGLALVLTSLTTAAGLLSFSTAALEPVAMLGIFAPAGVIVALFLSLTMLPALLTLARFQAPSDTKRSAEENLFDRFLVRCGRFGTSRPLTVVSLSLLLVIFASMMASRMELSHNPLTWMGEDSRIVRDTDFINAHLGGAVTFEVLLESDTPGRIREPATLQHLAALGQSFEQEERDGVRAGQSVSLADVVKEINRALNANDADAYAIPDDPLLVAQELLLFENTGTDDLEDITDSQYEVARMTVRVPWKDAVQYTTFFDLVKADTEAALAPYGRPIITGTLSLLVRTINAVVTSMAQSYLLAFAVITPLMVFLLGSLRTGLLAMIPNTLPILLTLGLMGVFGFPLDVFSLMVGGIALGLAVDDTIHFMHNYRRYREQGLALEDAVEKTLLTAGRAMLITTIVLSVGFLGFVMSSMENLRNLGVLVAFATTTAFFADVLLAPALLALFDRRKND
jgi:predicted RND superfamily exporter protein